MKKRYVYHFSAYAGRNGNSISHGIISVDIKIDSMDVYNRIHDLVSGEICKEHGLRLKESDISITSLTFLHEVKE